LAEIVQGLLGGDPKFHRVDETLHRSPSLLREHLQAVIDAHPRQRIVLTMGLCGGATAGLRAGSGGLSLPRVDDCLALLLGSRQLYRELAAQCAGTYYLSKGWVEARGSLLADHARWGEQWGAAKARQVFGTLLRKYRRVVYIHAGLLREDLAVDQGKAFAAQFQLDFSIAPADLRLLAQLLRGEPAREIIALPAGAGTSLADFLEPLAVNCPSRPSAPPCNGWGRESRGND
jgi:hypothetical protein